MPEKNSGHALLHLTKYIRPYRKEAFYALAALTAAIVFELMIPRLVQRIIDEGIAQQDLSIVYQTGALMLGATIIGALLAITNNIFSIRVAQKTGMDLRRDFFIKVQSLSLGDLDDYQTGQLLVRATSDITQVQSIFLIFMRIGTRAPLLMIGSLVFLFATSTELAMMMLIILPITVFLIYIFAKQLRPLFKFVQEQLDGLNTILEENLSGIRVVKAFSRANYEKQRFDDANTAYMQRNIKVMQITALLMPVLTLIINLTTLAAIWFGGNLVTNNNLTVGQIIAFVNYLMTTMLPMGLIAMAIGLVAGAMVSAGRIEEILEKEPSIQNIKNARSLPDGNGHLIFEKVDFSYANHEDDLVLKNINFEAEPGKTLAILGATGSGKSSLINLIPRFYDPLSGVIRIDGKNIREVKKETLWKAIGYAFQETVLFTGTIADNIRFGREDASMEEVIAAAKAAQAHQFITDMPNGYETEVQQRGVNLSGGQKQRIAIARALLVQPRILLLDDSTSAVDVETEAALQEALEKLMHNRTCIMVAQRISSVLTADKIIVLDKGEIAAQGTHESLMQTSPIYQEIYDSQLGKGRLHYVA